jgi:nitrilase
MTRSKALGGREKVIVAVAQIPPIYMDRDATIELASEAMHKAARNGAELIAFSEAWLPGYPMWTEGWDSDVGEWAEMREVWQDCGVAVPGPEADRLALAARDASINVVIGINELDSRPNVGTLYNSLLFIDRAGNLLGTHRKLCCTFAERTFYGLGDSSDIRVFDFDIGRVSGLICGEMWMPMLKAAIIGQGEDFHVASWVGAYGYDGPGVNDREAVRGSSPTHSSSRAYACDSGAFVLNALGKYSRDSVSPTLPYADKLHLWPPGGSGVFGPSGQTLAGPDYDSDIVYAVCEAKAVKFAKGILDSLGHYSRPDCVRVQVFAQNREHVVFEKGFETRDVQSSKPDLSSRRIRDVSESLDVQSGALRNALDEALATVVERP